MTGKLPQRWPGKKALLPAITFMRLQPNKAVFAKMFASMSANKMKRHYPVFRTYYNDINTKRGKDNG